MTDWLRMPSEAAMREAKAATVDGLRNGRLIKTVAEALDRYAAAQREKDAKIAWDFSAEAAAAIRGSP